MSMALEINILLNCTLPIPRSKARMYQLPNHRRSLLGGSGKNAPVPAGQLGQKYHFVLATILTLISYTKWQKDIRNVFAAKIHQHAFAAGALSRIPLKELP